MSSELDDLDVAQTLAAAGDSTANIQRAEVRALEVDLHFAALHTGDPQAGRGRRPSLPEARGSGMTRDAWEAAGNKLVQLGGDGTPMVQDLPLCELAVARGIHETAARGQVADALDLSHRLPGYWAALQAGRGRVWVGRRIARMSRHLDREQVQTVDAAVTQALEGRPDLAACETRDELRAEAFGWLAHPEDVIALLNGTHRSDDEAETPHEPHEEPARLAQPRVVLHAHISQAAVDARLTGSTEGVVVRVEELGPMLLEAFMALTGRADFDLKPVVDLNTGRSVNQYEHPVDVKERGLLRTTGDVFSHAQSQSRRLDSDHPDPYEPNGPPGQTGDHNQAPLGRRHHRAKTHQAYRVHQLGPGRYLWRTPHGLWRMVDGTGTHPLDEGEAQQYLTARVDEVNP